MYEDSHINQVSFTTRRHPIKYLRYDIHHVDDMKPQKASFRTKTHPYKTHAPSLHPNNPTPHTAKEAYSTARNHPCTSRRQIRKTHRPP